MDKDAIKWAEDDCRKAREAYTRRSLGGLSIHELPLESALPLYPPITDGAELFFPTFNFYSGQVIATTHYVGFGGRWWFLSEKKSAATKYRI